MKLPNKTRLSNPLPLASRNDPRNYNPQPRCDAALPVAGASARTFGREISKVMFIIEDEIHAEIQAGEFASFVDALTELHRRASLPWDKPPNVCPCTSWKTCGRLYEIIEYDTSTTPWTELQRIPTLEIGAAGIKWLYSETRNKDAEQSHPANPRNAGG